MGHGIEKALDVRVKHPVHLLPINPGVESIQRIVLAAPRSNDGRWPGVPIYRRTVLGPKGVGFAPPPGLGHLSTGL